MAVRLPDQFSVDGVELFVHVVVFSEEVVFLSEDGAEVGSEGGD